MKKFLRNIGVFVLLSLVLMAIFQAVLVYPRKDLMTLPEGTTTVYMGNSTIELSINDKLLANSFNFGRGAETFEMIYLKLKLIKHYNSGIDTLVIGFDDMILSLDDYIPNASPKGVLIDAYSIKDWINNINYYSIKNNKEFVSVLYHYSNIMPMLCYSLNISRKGNYIGGFYGAQGFFDDEKRHDYRDIIVNKDNLDFPSINKYYLDKIVEFCRENQITLIFLSTPKHRYFWTRIGYIYAHEKFYPNIPLIDCMNLEFPDSCFRDVVHLNHIGADKFTLQLKEILDKNLNKDH